MEPREVYLSFHLDTNRINSRSRLENMNKLEHWANEGIIVLYMSQVAHNEARADGDTLRIRKALGNIYSYTLADTAEERARMKEIEAAIFPSGAKTTNERNDVEIAFNAGKYGTILVTADGDLLGHRRELSRLGVKVMGDDEAVALVEHRIAERDERARQIAGFSGAPVPSWVGQDSLLTRAPTSGL
jgi:hypothetical protein